MVPRLECFRAYQISVVHTAHTVPVQKTWPCQLLMWSDISLACFLRAFFVLSSSFLLFVCLHVCTGFFHSALLIPFCKSHCNFTPPPQEMHTPVADRLYFTSPHQHGSPFYLFSPKFHALLLRIHAPKKNECQVLYSPESQCL